MLFLILLTTVLLSITSISAENTNDTNTLQDNNHHIQPVTQQSNTTQIQNTKYVQNNTKNLKKEESNDIYIDSSSTNQVEDGTIDNPYKTITETIITNNSKLHVNTGTYYLKSMNITKNTTIIGQNRNSTIFIANDTSSIFTISDNNQLTLINITLKDYESSTQAAITNNGNLTVRDSCFLNNTGLERTSKGGSIYNTGILYVENTDFSSNTASWGASIYNNRGRTTIRNSNFTKDNTYNVGGSVYSIRGNLLILNSNFKNNSAVSGGAVYNAFGNVTINNTLFLKNQAASFYGGALYSTGIVRITNSQFLYNHGTYNGGAITNTNNFTAINCTFESNSAGESGGAIENIAWTATENGNLTLINCNFTENSATVNGGAIANLNTTPVEGNYGTITARNSVFRLNTAGEKGGAIWNEQYINLEYNAFIGNEAETNNTIYSNSSLIKSIENNWWGNNNPKWDKIGVIPDHWVVMTFTNTTPLIEKLDTTLLVTINSLNNGDKLSSNIPIREVVYIANNTVFTENFQNINNQTINTCKPEYENISVLIDDQLLTLTPLEANITYILLDNNQTIQFNINLPNNINGKASIKINGKTIINKVKVVNGKASVKYAIPTSWGNKNYTATIVLNTINDKKLSKNITITIPKRSVTAKITIKNTTAIRTGDTIQMITDVTCGNKKVTNGKVSFKINGKTIASNVRIVNGKAIINYTIPQNFNPKQYNVSIVYGGDNNKYSCNNKTIMTISKQNAHVTPNSTLYLMSDSGVSITMGVLDSHNNYVSQGKICYKINGKTIKTNITLTDGVFTFEYVTPAVKSGQTLKQTLTIRMGANKKYNAMTIRIPIVIS